MAGADNPLGNVLVTGAAQRIGAAIATALATYGYGVVIHYRRSAREAKALQAKLLKSGCRAALCQADLTDRTDMEGLVDRAASAIGAPLSALVNNASMFEFDRAKDVTYERLDLHLRANLMAPAFLAKHFVRQLPAGSMGAIVNLLDQKLANPNPDFFSYSLSRYALAGATTLMAQDFSGHARVNAVAPGITLPSGGQGKTEFDAVAGENLLKAKSSPLHVAEAVRMLIASPAINGQCIWVDGGQRFMSQRRDVMFMKGPKV